LARFGALLTDALSTAGLTSGRYAMRVEIRQAPSDGYFDGRHPAPVLAFDCGTDRGPPDHEETRRMPDSPFTPGGEPLTKGGDPRRDMTPLEIAAHKRTAKPDGQGSRGPKGEPDPRVQPPPQPRTPPK
jgi:hypothetical protein